MQLGETFHLKMLKAKHFGKKGKGILNVSKAKLGKGIYLPGVSGQSYP